MTLMACDVTKVQCFLMFAFILSLEVLSIN